MLKRVWLREAVDLHADVELARAAAQGNAAAQRRVAERLYARARATVSHLTRNDRHAAGRAHAPPR